MANNEFFINTGINTDGIKKGAQDINRTMEQVAEKSQKSLDSISDNQGLDKATQSAGKLADEMQRVADAKESMQHVSDISPQDYIEAYENLEKTRKMTQEQIDALVEARTQAQGLSGDLQGQNTTIDTSGAVDLAQLDTSAIDDYVERLQDVPSLWSNIKYNILEALTPVHNAIAEHERLANTVALVIETFKGASVGKAVLMGIGAAAKLAVGGVVTLAEGLGRIAVNGAKAVGSSVVNGIKKMGSQALETAKNVFTLHRSNNQLTGSFKKGFWTILKYGIGIRSLYILIRKLRTAVKDGLGNLSKEDDKTNASISALVSSLATLKNAFATAFSPIVNIVAPILAGFINQLVEVANTIAAVMARITGAATFQKAIAVQKDYAKSLDKTSKSAKNQTLSIDELNQSVDESQGGGGAGTQDMFEETAIDEQQSKFADRLKEMWADADFTDLGSIFGGKIAGALDAIKWNKIKTTAGKIGKSIATFINGTVEFPELGYKVGNTLAQAFNTALEFCYQFVTNLHWDSVGKFIGDALNGGLLNFDWKKLAVTISEGIKGYMTLLTNIFDTVNWQEIGRKLAEFFKNIDYKGIAESFVTLLGTAIASAIEFLYGFIEDAVKSIKEYFQKYIDEYIAKTGDDNLGHAIIAGIFNGIIDALVNVGQWIYDHIFTPFIEGFKKAFEIHSPSHVMFEMGGYIIDGLYNGLLGIWDRIKGIFENFKAKIKEKVLSIKQDCEENFTMMKNNIKNTIESLKTKVVDIFDALKSGIKTPINAILGIIETFCNGIVRGINKVINSLNALKIDVPDWVSEKFGISSFGFSIPTLSEISLPKLATGTVVPRQSKEFAAVLGDNNRETEVVSPLSTIESAVANVLEPYLERIIDNTEKLIDKDTSVNIGDREIARANNRGQKLLGYTIAT